MPIEAFMPVITSAMLGPTFIGPAPGSPSGWPVTLINPPAAWKIAS